jgi:hypothetical protein
MTNRKRIGALLLCVGLVLALSVSAVFVAHEAGHHDCRGEDCPVCRMIAASIRLLRGLGLACTALLALCLLLPGQAARRRQERLHRVFSGTPVSWKIRLND